MHRQVAFYLSYLNGVLNFQSHFKPRLRLKKFWMEDVGMDLIRSITRTQSVAEV